jgi:Flp pilus assembly pilin Flp
MNIQPLALIKNVLDSGESGQALAEYGLILGLVFVAAIAGLALLGGSIADPISAFVNNFGGSGGS